MKINQASLKNILITGATGLVGKGLVKRLHEHGHQISILSRHPQKVEYAKAFRWDVNKQEIDNACLKDIDTIIHLAGENIAGKRWTAEQKKKIIDSRVKSIELLYRAVKETKSTIETIISMSAVGFYGDRCDEILTEESKAGSGFLAESCVAWEAAVDDGMQLGGRVVKLRLGVLLSEKGGALKSLEKPVQYFAGAPLASGNQWISWIHYDDLLSIIETAVDNTAFKGVYNVSTPFPVTNTEMTKVLAKTLHRPVWPIHVPQFMLKLILGEMAAIVLSSDRSSVQKLLDTGFEFQYPHLEDALTELYK